MKRLSWIEILILPVGLAALTTCWLALWVRWIMLAGGLAAEPSVSPLLMLITLVGGTFVTRWAVASVHDNVHLQRPQQIVALSGLASVIAVLWITFGRRFPFDFLYNFTNWRGFFSAESIALVVAVLLWWRSIRIGRNDDLHETAQREFSGGVMALTLLFIFNKVTPLLPASQAFWPIMIFFAVGLGALAVAGFEQDRRIQKKSTGTTLGVSRHWLGTVVAIIGLILVGGLIVAALTDPDSITSINTVLDIVGIIVITIVGFTVYFIALILMPIGEALARAILPILEILLNLSFGFSQSGLTPPSPEVIVEAAQRLARTPPFRILEIAIVVGLIVLVFILAVRRLRLLAHPDNSDETHESIFSRELLWAQLKSLFARRTGSPVADLPPYLDLDGPTDDPHTLVRRAYQSMLQWAATRNLTRSPRQTPLAYAQALSATIPQAQTAITILTEVYVRARYSDHLTLDDARLAQTAVEQLSSLQRNATS